VAITTPLPDVLVTTVLAYVGAPPLKGKFLWMSVQQFFSNPIDLCVYGEGNERIIGIVESASHTVRICRYDNLNLIRTIGNKEKNKYEAKSVQQIQQELNYPRGIIIDKDEIFISESPHSRIKIFNINGFWDRNIGEKEEERKLAYPTGLAIEKKNEKNEIFIAEVTTHCISVWNHKNGNLLRQWGKKGVDNADFNLGETFLCFSPNGEELYISDSGNNMIKVFNPKNGIFLRKFGEGKLRYPTGITMNNTHIYVVDNNERIVVFDMSGEMIKSFCSKGSKNGQLSGAFGITLTSDDQLIVADYGNSSLQWFQ